MNYAWHDFKGRAAFLLPVLQDSISPLLVAGRLHFNLMFLLTRPWTSEDRSSVIGRKWTCAVKWIWAVSGLELCGMFPLRWAHWNSMGTLVIRLSARWRCRVTTRLLFHSLFFFFYLTGNKFVFYKTRFLYRQFAAPSVARVVLSWTSTAQRRRLVKSNKQTKEFLSTARFEEKAETSTSVRLPGLVVPVRQMWPMKTSSVTTNENLLAHGCILPL